MTYEALSIFLLKNYVKIFYTECLFCLQLITFAGNKVK